MRRIVTSEQMKQLDAYTIEQMAVPSLVLMERAALAVVEELVRGFDLGKVLVVCGSGNNGADGMAIARILWLRGYAVSVFLVGRKESFSKEAQIQWKILENYCVPIVNNCCYAEYTTIVDAIFGVGLTREVSGHYREVLQGMNASGLPIVAVDIPSGVCGTTGHVLGEAVCAACTVTFAYGKSGLYLYPGAAFAGKIIVKDIGIYAKDDEQKKDTLFALDAQAWEWLPKRLAYGNKGTFGKVLVIAGSKEMCGAAYLSAKAALLSGAGMVRIFTAKENRIALQQLLPEALITTYKSSLKRKELESLLTEALAWADVVLAGPGLGTNSTARWLVEALLAQERQKAIVLDADALNLLSKQKEFFYQTQQSLVLTPHLGEMARISGYTIEELKQNPVGCLRNFAKVFASPKTIVMKDARTLTLTKDETCYINLTGNSGMATAGSGDVLAGILAGLLAQGMDEEKAAPFAVWLHGCAGDYACQQKGAHALCASDILDAIPYVMMSGMNA